MLERNTHIKLICEMLELLDNEHLHYVYRILLRMTKDK